MNGKRQALLVLGIIVCLLAGYWGILFGILSVILYLCINYAKR